MLENLFQGDADSVKLSTLKNKFYQYLPAIKKSATIEAVTNGWIVKEGNQYMISFIFWGIILVWLSFWAAIFSVLSLYSIFIAGFIFIVFGIFMPKRTQAGVDLLFRIKGFELYMKQAENYRAAILREGKYFR